MKTGLRRMAGGIASFSAVLAALSCLAPWAAAPGWAGTPSPEGIPLTMAWCLLALVAVSGFMALALAAVIRSRRENADEARRYRELVERAPCLILRFDENGRPTYANAFAERFLGYSREELLAGRVSFMQRSAIDFQGMLAQAMSAPETLGADPAEGELTTRDGRRVHVLWANQPLFDAAGNPDGWLASGADITARKRTDNALAARLLAEERIAAFGRELLAGGRGDIGRALAQLLSALGVDRAAWYVNGTDPQIGPCCLLSAEANAPGLAPQAGNPAVATIPYSIDGFGWADRMAAGEVIGGVAGDFTRTQQEVFRHFGILAVLAAPVRVNGVWDGFLAVGDTREARVFSRFEQTLLLAAADLLSARLSRPAA